MALTIETGDGLPAADSYVSLDEVRAFAESRGQSVPADDAELEAQIRLAHDYLLQYEEYFTGSRRVADQGLSFPRCNFYLYKRRQVDGYIPLLLKNAVSQLVVEAQTVDLMPTAEDGRIATKETIGPITTEYQVNSTSPSFPKVLAFLAPLMLSNPLSLRSVRA